MLLFEFLKLTSRVDSLLALGRSTSDIEASVTVDIAALDPFDDVVELVASGKLLDDDADDADFRSMDEEEDDEDDENVNIRLKNGGFAPCLSIGDILDVPLDVVVAALVASGSVALLFDSSNKLGLF